MENVITLMVFGKRERRKDNSEIEGVVVCSGEKREDEEKLMAREGCGGRPRREKGMEQKAG